MKTITEIVVEELKRQHEMGDLYFDEEFGPTEAVVDGNLDIVAMAAAIEAAGYKSHKPNTPPPKPPPDTGGTDKRGLG